MHLSGVAEFWEDSAGAGDVYSVVVAEVLEHHLLFERDPHETERNNGHKESRPGDPVVQEQPLCKGPEHVSGVHRMADVAVHACRYETMVILDLGYRRPLPGQIDMGPPEKQ